MIMRLRDDWLASHGGKAQLRGFHDQFLSYGGPPIPLLRAQMLGGPVEAKLWSRRPAADVPASDIAPAASSMAPATN
jgi:hypothetical protein